MTGYLKVATVSWSIFVGLLESEWSIGSAHFACRTMRLNLFLHLSILNSCQEANDNAVKGASELRWLLTY